MLNSSMTGEQPISIGVASTDASTKLRAGLDAIDTLLEAIDITGADGDAIRKQIAAIVGGGDKFGILRLDMGTFALLLIAAATRCC